MAGERTRWLRRRARVLALALVLMVAQPETGRGMSAPVGGEGAHPSAVSYKRLTFVLNLNPVPWDVARSEIRTIAADLGTLAAEKGARYGARMEKVLWEAEAGPNGRGSARALRQAGARRIFVASTQAVATMIVLRLALASGSRGRFAAREAWRTWLALAREVEVTDPEGYATMARAWRVIGAVPAQIEESSGGAPPGALAAAEAVDSLDTTDGPIATDGADTVDSVRTIVRYVTENYGSSFEPAPTQRLVPLPTRSPTFDATRQVPVELPPGASIATQIPRPRQILGMVARGADESETTLIALGDVAFNSPFIFGEPSRSLGMSCNSCHNQGVTNPRLFVPGLSGRPGGMDVSNGFLAPHANNGHFDPVDTPDLRGIRYTAPYGRNGRFASLREFARNGIMHEFNGPEPDPLILDGLVAYMNEFDLLPNPYLAADGTLTERASAAARRGEEIFHRPFARLDGRSCASCHVPSDQFLDRGRHDIGAGRPSAEGARDGALDTPTLLGVGFTAPYFHDGSQATLRGVTEWFNERFQLGLGDQEVTDLTAYVETVGDGTDPYESGSECLEAELRECAFFLSTYEFLAERDDPGLMGIVFRTVAEIIRTHRTLIQDPAYAPALDQLARLMNEAYAANVRGDRATVDARVAAYRQLYEANQGRLR